VELPEKQGLKHKKHDEYRWFNINVAVELPEKQGLKQYDIDYMAVVEPQLQWNFQKNKD